jgi:hypothetical protein
MIDEITKVPNILLGYVIMRNMKFKSGTQTPNGIEWKVMEFGFQLECYKKKIYVTKEIADEAVWQLQKYAPSDEFEVHPVYWHGRHITPTTHQSEG